MCGFMMLVRTECGCITQDDNLNVTYVSTNHFADGRASYVKVEVTCASTLNGLVGLVCPSPGQNFYQKWDKTFKNKIRDVSENIISWENE